MIYTLITPILALMPLLPVSDPPVPEEHDLSRNYIKFQFAGNMGFLSAGYGRKFLNDRLTVDLNYGYLPKFINNSWVHTFAIKPAYHFGQKELTSFTVGYYAGTSINYARTRNTFLKYPDYFSEGYYGTNAIHINPFFGIRSSFPVNHKRFYSMTFYSDLGTVEYKIWYALKNKQISFFEIWNLSFGLSFNLIK